MKICLIAKTLNLKYGGVARVPIELRKGLEERGHKVNTVAATFPGSIGYLAHITTGIPLHLLNRDADVYHAITPMESLWLPKDRGVVTFLDFMMLNNWQSIDAGLDKNWKRGFGMGLYSFLASWASKVDKIVCISEETKDTLARLYKVKEDKVRVIRLGISEVLEPSKKDDIFRIGYLGQVDKRKRIDKLVLAFENTKQEAELLIGGEGSLRSPLQKEYELNKKIGFAGFVKEEELSYFYNKLDVFIFPSRVEGYGLPIVEAMACKKPVVVLSDGEIPSDLKSRCIVTDTLYEILKDKRRLHNLKDEVDIESNYRFAKEHSWTKCASQYEEVYKEIINGR